MDYKMSQAQYDSMVEKITAARNTPLIAIHTGMPPSAQEVANDCWAALGKEMGFEPMSVRPHPNGDKLAFTAAALALLEKELNNG